MSLAIVHHPAFCADIPAAHRFPMNKFRRVAQVLVEDGLVTEGTSSNAWIVQGKTLVTRQKSDDILHGITRDAVLTRAIEDGLAIEERPFSPEEARAANEAFQTSAAAFVMPVVCIDDTVIGDGRPGPVTRRLRALYLESARR